MKIKDQAKYDRPREKASRFGIESLSNQELLCLLIGSGTGKSDTFAIADSLLERSDNLCRLGEMKEQELLKIEGIGKARAAILLASLELARRVLKARAFYTPLHSEQDVVEWFEMEYGQESQEHFAACYLNTKGQMIRHKVLYIGTLNQSLVHPRDVFREAYLANACSVIFVHNHPSGDPTPSIADLQTTDDLCQAARICQIRVLDHIIVGKGCSFSFREQGLMEPEHQEGSNPGH